MTLRSHVIQQTTRFTIRHVNLGKETPRPEQKQEDKERNKKLRGG